MNQVYFAASQCVTPLGLSTADTFQAVQAGRSGLRPQWFDFSPESFHVATIDDDALEAAFATQGYVTPYAKLEKMSILAVAGALEQVDIPLTGPDTVLVYCTTKGNIDQLAAGPDTGALGASLSRLARTVARHFGFVNEPMVVSNACISGLQGLLVAQRLLRGGRYRHAVVVGADQVSKFILTGFHAFNAISRQPCRPFDAARQGINLGEAAAAVVLTTEPAAAHGIEVVAGSSSNDAHHISAPSRTGEGLYQAVTRVLSLAPEHERPDFIGAHGTATLYNDEMEAQAFHRAGLADVPLHSLKGYFGHTLGASGILEAALGVESLRYNELISSAGYETCGTTQLLRPIRQRTPARLRSFLKTSSGFGGCNAAVLFAKVN